MEAPQTHLQKLRDLLIYLEYNAELIPISEDMHFESLLVAMDPDPEAVEEYQYVAQMYFVEDLLNIEPDPEDTTSMATLQFVVNLPCQFDIDNESRFFTGLRLIQICNQILPAGSLGTTPKGELFYKYALKAENKNIPLPVIVDEVNLIGFFLPLFMPTLEAVDTTERSYQELSEEVERKVGTLFGKVAEEESAAEAQASV